MTYCQECSNYSVKKALHFVSSMLSKTHLNISSGGLSMASRVKTQSLTVRHVQDMWNWTGFCTLFKKEFLRFFKVPNNTIFPQLVTVLFYFLIFGLAIGALIKEV